MPNLYTHYLCGHKALEMLKDNDIKAEVFKNINAFNLGTQGPDILFYHHIWPWKRSKGVEDMGELMHHSKVGDMFAAILKYASGSSGKDADVLTSYILGFLSHYALDCWTHPYVFYKTGFLRKGEAPTKKYIYYHRRFETAIDTLMLQRELKSCPYDMKAHSLIQLDKEGEYRISQMYVQMLKQVYGIALGSREIVTSIRDMRKAFAVLRDKSGNKKKILSFIENRIASPGAFTSTIYDSLSRDNLDYLNTSHSPWYLPWDNSIKSTLSFIELFDKAVLEAASLWKAACAYLRGEADLDTAMERIGNRSFSTGQDCDLDLEFRFFDCIFENLQT